VAPQLYLQLARDGNPPAGESSVLLHLHRPGDVHRASKFTKLDFKDIEKGKADHDKTPTTAGWRWCSTTSPRPGCCPTRAARVPHRQGGRQPLHDRDGGAAGRGGAGATPRARGHGCSPARRKRTSSPRWPPGLELVKDYGWLHRAAKPLFWLLTSCTAVLGNWGWAIVGLVVLLKIAFYWLNASAYRRWPR
jgi:YidC/Oxa1 family membrane protein insertase